MKILIFGGSGFLGKELCKIFSEKMVRFDSVSRSNKECRFNFDISCKEDFQSLPRNYYNYVVNCASVLPGGHYLDGQYLEKIYRSNILGFQNICLWLNSQKTIIKAINCSTLAVNSKPWPVPLSENHCSRPVGNHVLYSMSKLMQEALFETYAQTKNNLVANLRFSTLYGPGMKWEGVMARFIEFALTKQRIEITNGDKVFGDFLHVHDAARIVYATITSPKAVGIINAASGKETSLNGLANIIAENLPFKIKVSNKNCENFQKIRAAINLEKLSSFIDPNTFKNLSLGISEILKK